MGLLDPTPDDSGQPAGGLMNLFANPQTAALLGLSNGLLAASGPSRIPVNFGQALASGMQGMQQGVTQGIDMQRQMLGMRALQNALSSSQPGAPAQPTQPAQPMPSAQDLPPVTGAPNVGALSGLSAGMGGFAAPTPISQMAASAPQQSPAGPSVFGKTPADLYRQGFMLSLGGFPQVGAEMMRQAFQADPSIQAQIPTDITKMGTQAGYTPQQIQDANAGGITKANYIPPVSGRPGGSLTGPDGVTRYNLPAPQAGAMWATNPDGSLIYNQAGQPYQIGIGGAIAAARGMSEAQASGPAQFKIVPGMQNGRPVNTTAYNIANGLPPPGQSGAPNGAPAQGGAFSGYQAPNSAPVAPSLPPGANTLAEGSAKSFNDLRAQAGSTPTAIDGYNRAEQTLLDGVTTGPGSTLGTNIIGRLNTAGIPLLKGDTTGYQSLQKYLANANAQAAAASGYNGSDARFESFSHGQPSTENMNPQALRYAIQYVRGQQFGVQAKYQAAQSFIAQQGGSTVNYPQFEAQWNKVYNPDVALVKAMPNPADQQAYLAQLKQQGKLDAWMKSYQQMQQLGAF